MTKDNNAEAAQAPMVFEVGSTEPKRRGGPPPTLLARLAAVASPVTGGTKSHKSIANAMDKAAARRKLIAEVRAARRAARAERRRQQLEYLKNVAAYEAAKLYLSAQLHADRHDIAVTETKLKAELANETVENARVRREQRVRKYAQALERSFEVADQRRTRFVEGRSMLAALSPHKFYRTTAASGDSTSADDPASPKQQALDEAARRHDAVIKAIQAKARNVIRRHESTVAHKREQREHERAMLLAGIHNKQSVAGQQRADAMAAECLARRVLHDQKTSKALSKRLARNLQKAARQQELESRQDGAAARRRAVLSGAMGRVSPSPVEVAAVGA